MQSGPRVRHPGRRRCTGGATEHISTGQQITVDGSAGGIAFEKDIDT